jgi:hypothetical protein
MRIEDRYLWWWQTWIARISYTACGHMAASPDPQTRRNRLNTLPQHHSWCLRENRVYQWRAPSLTLPLWVWRETQQKKAKEQQMPTPLTYHSVYLKNYHWKNPVESTVRSLREFSSPSNPAFTKSKNIKESWKYEIYFIWQITLWGTQANKLLLPISSCINEDENNCCTGPPLSLLVLDIRRSGFSL